MKEPRAQRLAGITGTTAAIATVVLAATYVFLFRPDLATRSGEPFLLPYALAGIAGLLLLLVSFISLIRGRPTRKLGTIGAALTVSATVVAREALRVRVLQIETLYEEHARVAESGGVIAFFIFFVLNACLITYCVRLGTSPRP